MILEIQRNPKWHMLARFYGTLKPWCIHIVCYDHFLSEHVKI